MTTIERVEVVLDGEKHLMTNEQIGNLVVDLSPQELESFKLAVAREMGLPEPELYNDEDVWDMEARKAPDKELLLDKLLTLQERMAKGMKMIEKADRKINVFFKDHRWMYKLYLSWSGKWNDQTTAQRFLTDPRNQGYITWFEYRKNLWDQWWKLQKESKELADTQGLWGEYFHLLEEEITRYFSIIDPEDIDNQSLLFQNSNQLMDEYRFTHLKEMELYNK